MEKYNYPFTLKKLIDNLSKLQGIGNKTAERIAFNLIKMDSDFIPELTCSLNDLKQKIKIAPSCHCMTDQSDCINCSDLSRKRNLMCVVETQQDVFYIDKSGFRGIYHELDGLVSPLDGIGEDDLNIANLQKRLDGIDEVILALPFTVEGEATSYLIKDRIKNFNVKISRPAKGLPAGIGIEYVDKFTLHNSIEERVQIDD